MANLLTTEDAATIRAAATKAGLKPGDVAALIVAAEADLARAREKALARAMQSALDRAEFNRKAAQQNRAELRRPYEKRGN